MLAATVSVEEISRRPNVFSLLALLLMLFAPGLLRAHDSPEHVVEMLTARMEVVGRRPDLLWRRATEYRVLGQLDAAEKDLRAALWRKRDFTQARLDLCRVQLALDQTNAALRTIRKEVSKSPKGSVDPGVRMMYAEVLTACGRVADAVVECDRALAADAGGNAEWYLTRCYLLYRLGRFDQAADGLRKGVDATGNAVLEAEWIDALIDAGRFEAAMAPIATQLAESRCQASWLIRRGRVEAGRGRVTEAHTDFLSAIRELNGRLGHGRLDFTLLAERGTAYALLGDLELAKSDLNRARANGADDWAVHRLERVIDSSR